MSDHSINSYIKAENVRSLWVWFEGTTALLEGQGVCYNWDYGAATASDARRTNHVELPTILNARYFAGVAARAYSAKSGGQFIEIYGPGSTCSILLKQDVVLGTNLRVTCEAGGTYAGYFRDPGFQGEGSARPLQTVTAAATAALCLAKLEEGEPSGLVENVVANTDALLDGGATTIMVGGVTYFDTDISTGGNATATLADGTVPGLKKAFVARIAQTQDVVVTVTSGIEGVANADPTDTLATITLDADLEECTVQWDSFDTAGVWVVQHTVGATIA